MTGIAAYKENAVTTQTKGKLIVLLYEGAIKFLKQAIAELEAEDFVEKGQYVNKAIEIIIELSVSLNMEAGGEVADNLQQLYDFMMTHLTKANFRRDVQGFRDVIGLLEELNEGWKAVTA